MQECKGRQFDCLVIGAWLGLGDFVALVGSPAKFGVQIVSQKDRTGLDVKLNECIFVRDVRRLSSSNLVLVCIPPYFSSSLWSLPVNARTNERTQESNDDESLTPQLLVLCLGTSNCELSRQRIVLLELFNPQILAQKWNFLFPSFCSFWFSLQYSIQRREHGSSSVLCQKQYLLSRIHSQ